MWDVHMSRRRIRTSPRGLSRGYPSLFRNPQSAMRAVQWQPIGSAWRGENECDKPIRRSQGGRRRNTDELQGRGNFPAEQAYSSMKGREE
jgi:hypothetical protein